MPYQLTRLNLAKRGCSDDANLCEVIDINAGEGEQAECVREVLKNSNFETQYRRQLEKTSANGTVACYLRLDNATFMSDSSVKGGRIKLNYVDADAFLPLTVEDGIVTEAAFSGSAIKRGKRGQRWYCLHWMKRDNTLQKPISLMNTGKSLWS